MNAPIAMAACTAIIVIAVRAPKVVVLAITVCIVAIVKHARITKTVPASSAAITLKTNQAQSELLSLYDVLDAYL